MTADQKKAALALVKAGTSESGFVTATTIMSLEAILLEQEGKKGAMVRNPGWYSSPSSAPRPRPASGAGASKGHHLSLNFTMEGTQVVASTPCSSAPIPPWS